MRLLCFVISIFNLGVLSIAYFLIIKNRHIIRKARNTVHKILSLTITVILAYTLTLIRCIFYLFDAGFEFNVQIFLLVDMFISLVFLVFVISALFSKEFEYALY